MGYCCCNTLPLMYPKKSSREVLFIIRQLLKVFKHYLIVMLLFGIYQYSRSKESYFLSILSFICLLWSIVVNGGPLWTCGQWWSIMVNGGFFFGGYCGQWWSIVVNVVHCGEIYLTIKVQKIF